MTRMESLTGAATLLCAAAFGASAGVGMALGDAAPQALVRFSLACAVLTMLWLGASVAPIARRDPATAVLLAAPSLAGAAAAAALALSVHGI